MKKWNRFKLDILYYLSAIDLALTGFAFTVRYVVKHRRFPEKTQKYSREEILEELKKISGIVPAVNQIECHPLCYPKELIEYCQSEGIQVQAYAHLARGAYLDNDVMCVLGTKYAHTPAQVGLRWAIQKGISVIPKSVNPDRIASNANIFDFNIEDEDMAIMDTLNEDLHTSHVPDDLKDVIF